MRVAIIGTGLIGTSIGLALRRRQRKAEIFGWDSKRATAALAKRRGALTRIAKSADEAIAAAHIVILATPLDALLKLIPKMLRRAHAGALVMDVAGLQLPAYDAFRCALAKSPQIRAVTTHPLAGAECAGPEHADADLFTGRPFLLSCPPQVDRSAALQGAATFARLLGAIPIRVDPRRHDRIIALTSALPQLAGVALAQAIGGLTPSDLRTFSGPALADMTRLARSPFEIWRGPLRMNAANARAASRTFERHLRQLAAALSRDDLRLLKHSFAAAAATQRRLQSARGSTARPLKPPRR